MLLKDLSHALANRLARLLGHELLHHSLRSLYRSKDRSVIAKRAVHPEFAPVDAVLPVQRFDVPQLALLPCWD
jgi:hypothetical protein